MKDADPKRGLVQTDTIMARGRVVSVWSAIRKLDRSQYNDGQYLTSNFRLSGHPPGTGDLTFKWTMSALAIYRQLTRYAPTPFADQGFSLSCFSTDGKPGNRQRISRA